MLTDVAVDMVLSQVRLDDGSAADIAITDGRISEIAAANSLTGKTNIDGKNNLLLPALVNGHIHLDKTLLGLPWVSHIAGDSVQQRVAAEKTIRREHSSGMAARATGLLEKLIGFGTTALRCHVDIDEEVGIGNLQTLLAVREAFRDQIDIQFVAFPQSGLFGKPEIIAHMNAALQSGADVVGGLDPAGLDGNIDGQLDLVFALAKRFDKPIDIHLHDAGDLGAEQLREISQRAIAAGRQGRVAVSHAFALGAVDGAVFSQTADMLAKADVSIMTNGPGGVPMPPVPRLKASGVRVFAGTDNIRDAWSPYGTGDMLERLRHIGYLSSLNTDADLRHAFDLGTANARAALGLEPVALTVGSPADLMLLDATHIPEALVSNPTRKLVLKSGRIVAQDGICDG